MKVLNTFRTARVWGTIMSKTTFSYKVTSEKVQKTVSMTDF